MDIDSGWTKYSLYQRKYDFKSLLGISYFWSLTLLLVGIIAISTNYSIPWRLVIIRQWTMFIPIVLSLLSIIIIIINWSIYLVSKILFLDYSKTIVAEYVEDILWSVFPKKLYSRWIFKFSFIRSHDKKTIYYWVILNIVIIIIIIISQAIISS